MNPILVTGGAGFIGSHLVERLISNGEKVIVIDDLSNGMKKNLERVKDKITFYKRSITGDLNDLFEKYKFSVVFHLATLPRVQFSIVEPIKTHKVNVDGTLNLLEMCK